MTSEPPCGLTRKAPITNRRSEVPSSHQGEQLQPSPLHTKLAACDPTPPDQRLTRCHKRDLPGN